ncbi:putative membrane protein [Acidipila rosea]|uniref:Putative membrane protein n=2 Tax=Acidipila rosea TaxID=768535 RepID=A0A4V2PUF8_9BACT|nr:putative membrane protein [Acidipila rosea]
MESGGRLWPAPSVSVSLTRPGCSRKIPIDAQAHLPLVTMTTPAEQNADPRTYFASERTFLAWIRTGIALMGFGFVVSRFGLFLRELRPNDVRLPSHATGLSLWLGMSLVGLGVAVNIGSAIRHIHLTKLLREGRFHPGKLSTLATVVALLLAMVGLGMMAYLLRVH